MPSDLSLDAQLRLADYRLRVLNREPVTADEYHMLMRALRGDRENAARASAANKRAAKKIMGGGDGTKPASVSLDQMFPQMAQPRAKPAPLHTDDE